MVLQPGGVPEAEDTDDTTGTQYLEGKLMVMEIMKK